MRVTETNMSGTNTTYLYQPKPASTTTTATTAQEPSTTFTQPTYQNKVVLGTPQVSYPFYVPTYIPDYQMQWNNMSQNYSSPFSTTYRPSIFGQTSIPSMFSPVTGYQNQWQQLGNNLYK